MKSQITVKQASAIGVVGSAVNVGMEYAAVRYFGGRAPLADMPHQVADVFAYGAVMASRYTDKAKHNLEKASSWLVSAGSLAVAVIIFSETSQKLAEHGFGLNETTSWAEPATLTGVLAINGVIHAAQHRAHIQHHGDHGAHVNHKHAQSEWYATAGLLAGASAAAAMNAPLLERVVAVGAAVYVGYTNLPTRQAACD